MKTTFLALVVGIGGLCTEARAQPAVNPQGVTTLVLSAADIRLINNPFPPGRVRVPPYESVRLQAPPISGPLQWWKNNTPIPGATSATLTLPFTTPTDSGFYNVVGAADSLIASSGVRLDVVPSANLTNFSSLVQLSPAGSQTVGFVVAGETPAVFLVRAVGGSLRPFGVANPATAPRMQFFDSRGRPLSFVRVVDITAPPFDWSALFASAGAFALTGGSGTDAYEFGRFQPGTYTVRLTDASGQGGSVLFETYVLSPPVSPFVGIPTPPL